MSIRDALAKLVLGHDLSRAEANAAMRALVEGEATPSQIAAFAIALRMKGETPEEIAGLAEVMREAATRVDAGPDVVDVVGTGGDGAGTFNISTLSALVVASAGGRVAKHGNRSVTSACGAADFLEAIGVAIELSPVGVARCVAEAEALAPDFVVISPGPGVPRDAGISIDLIRALGPKVPTLGVCLGHQAIAEAFGGAVARAPELMHGKASAIHHNGSGVFDGIESPFSAIRYHSLCAAPEAVPDSLEVTARTDTGVVMAVRHREYPIHGVQFHPESILTEHGKELLRNFLRMGVPGRVEQTAAA